MDVTEAQRADLSRTCAHLDEPILKITQARDHLRQILGAETPAPHFGLREDVAHWKGVICEEANKIIAAVSP